MAYVKENAKQEAFNVEFAPSGITSPVPRCQSVFCHSFRLAKTELKGCYGVANCVRMSQIVQILLSEVEQDQRPSGNGDREAIIVGAGLCDGEGERAYTAYAPHYDSQ